MPFYFDSLLSQQFTAAEFIRRNLFVPVGSNIKLGIRLWSTAFRVLAVQVVFAIVGTFAGGCRVARPAFMSDT